MNLLKLFIFSLFLIVISCKKSSLDTENSIINTVSIEIGYSFLSCSYLNGGYVKQPFILNESDNKSTGQFTFDFNPEGDYILTFYPNQGKIKSEFEISGPLPGPISIISDETVYVILKKKNYSELAIIDSKPIHEIKMTFKNNTFGFLCEEFNKNIEELNKGISGKLIISKYLKLNNVKYNL